MEIRLTQGNTFEEMAALARKVTAFLEEQSAPSAVVFATELTLEELITNTIKYGYDDEARHEIEVMVRLDADRVTVEVTDDGHAFDPLALPEPDVTAPIEERQIGGLGIHLLRKMMTTLRYERVADRNVVTATKDLAGGDE